MAIYTVHAPPTANAPIEAAERLVIIEEGFSFGAFLVPPLWLLVHRLWVPLAGWIAAVALFVAVGRFAGSGTAILLYALVALWLGLEARQIRRWSLEASGWHFIGLVEAGDLDAAERRFLAKWIKAPTIMVEPPAGGRPDPYSRDREAGDRGEVIALFPTRR